eukprot:gene12816-biopygen5423
MRRSEEGPAHLTPIILMSPSGDHVSKYIQGCGMAMWDRVFDCCPGLQGSRMRRSCKRIRRRPGVRKEAVLYDCNSTVLAEASM